MKFGLQFMFLLSIITHYQTIDAFLQKDYHAIYERALISYFNPKFYKNVLFELRFFNRTTKAMYCQYEHIKDMDMNVEGSIISYKLYSNEYRGFPIPFNFNFCQELVNGTFGFDDIKKYSNVTNCPWKKGVYIIKDYVPDETKFPPFFPHGRYKGVCRITYHSELLFEGHIYFEIKGIKRFGNTTVYV